VVQASGFTLGAAPWPEMQRAGIRPGDTIATVNGLPVGDMERDVVDAIASGKARVEVVRDGRQVVLSAARDKE
jgi:C-terminal processing protease CtpA/Prc